MRRRLLARPFSRDSLPGHAFSHIKTCAHLRVQALFVDRLDWFPSPPPRRKMTNLPPETSVCQTVLTHIECSLAFLGECSIGGVAQFSWSGADGGECHEVLASELERGKWSYCTYIL